MKKRAPFRKKSVDRGEAEKDKITCHYYKKEEHIKIECPKLRENLKAKKKALVTTWSDSEESSSEDEHQECANLY